MSTEAGIQVSGVRVTVRVDTHTAFQDMVNNNVGQAVWMCVKTLWDVLDEPQQARLAHLLHDSGIIQPKGT